MGEDSCGDCRSWEEDIYWKHFQSLHFYQFLRPGFDQRLAIPEQFTKNLSKKLPKIVNLKGPSGRIWEVGLTTNDDTVYFNHGWQEFANDHLLREKDMLIFKYNVDSCFDVLIFDGRSMCEKAASYFVKKCGHKEQDSGCQTKRKIGEAPVEALPPSENHFEGLTPEKSANNDICTPPLKQPRASSSKKARMDIDWFISVHEEPSTSVEEVETQADMEHVSPSMVHDVPYISSRRLVTEEEKLNALQAAQAVLTRDGFMVVMKPTHVYRRFYMSIPAAWMAKYLSPLERRDVILRVNDNHWVTKFCFQRARYNGGLSGGWKNFALGNNLQEFDVLVFEPSSEMHKAVILDVHIFRVNQEDQ